MIGALREEKEKGSLIFWVFSTKGQMILFSKSLHHHLKILSFTEEFRVRKEVIRDDSRNSYLCSNGEMFVSRLLFRSDCLCPGVIWLQLVTRAKTNELCEGPSVQVVIVNYEKREEDWLTLTSGGSNIKRVELDEEAVAMTGNSDDWATNCRGRFEKVVTWWSRYFGGVKNNFDGGNLPKYSIWIELASFIV